MPWKIPQSLCLAKLPKYRKVLRLFFLPFPAESADLGIHGDIHPQDGAAFINFYFQGNVVNTVLYLIWFVALWFHLTHGFWSAIHTIGWNNTVWLSRWECISKWVATIICGLFAVITVIFYLNGVGA